MSYYVEFRARESDIGIGHTYLVYGTRGADGKPIAHNVVGFYPAGGYVGLLVTVVAIPGVVGKADDDERLPDVNVYRRNLTAEDYEHLAQFIAQKQATTQLFNVFTNNCNDFAAEVAKAIGLKVPSDRFERPESFIAELSDMNPPAASSNAASTTMPPGGPVRSAGPSDAANNPS